MGVVSTVTTKELVNQDVLVPLKVFVAKEIDMTGAKKIAGEWSAAEAEKRGMVITGDIVTEWIKKTHEFFGKAEKTIVFCSGVAHGADLSRKFSEQGFNFVSVSYLDADSFKQDVIKEFSKPDTEIHGFLSLSFWYVIVDIKKWWGGGPFRAMGMNSITMFTGSVFLSIFFPLSFLLSTTSDGCPNPDNNSHGFLLFRSMWNSVFVLILANWMDYEKFYINL